MLCLQDTTLDTFGQPSKSKEAWNHLFLVNPHNLHHLHTIVKQAIADTPVVPLPECYTYAKTPYSLVGGKQIPFIPLQVRRAKARRRAKHRLIQTIKEVDEDSVKIHKRKVNNGFGKSLQGPVMAVPGLGCYL
ncbi:hypothetical protein THRCLA_20326 [Thraustotheca clavata]|uniref:Uncharacterized protein n=1 Tax=Thraustotheca clavata TaxID=74557 RepID=A0A1W0A8L7_9STRA|nr:hypothetical protein THRCLA_20326 [Thraustotheca clavata]